MTTSFWLKEKPIVGTSEAPKPAEIAILGSGISGVSTAYWLLKKGFKDIVLIDSDPTLAATFRNCGHILHGTVESIHALCQLKGIEEATKIWTYSVIACDLLADTIGSLGLDCDYDKSGYLVVSMDQQEELENDLSTKLLRKIGYDSEIYDTRKLNTLGFENVLSARFEKGSASVHPLKLRNGILKWCMDNGLKYHSGNQVEAINANSTSIDIKINNRNSLNFPFVVIAANAFSPLLCEYIKLKSLVVPFRGQIIFSKKLDRLNLTHSPHSFNHGYEYGLFTKDKRLLLGGWRDKIPGKEEGDFCLKANDEITAGLKGFASRVYQDSKQIEWESAWTGIMAASATGLPFVGPTYAERLFLNLGFTGHGLPWGHGTGKLLAEIILGESSHPIIHNLRIPS